MKSLSILTLFVAGSVSVSALPSSDLSKRQFKILDLKYIRTADCTLLSGKQGLTKGMDLQSFSPETLVIATQQAMEYGRFKNRWGNRDFLGVSAYPKYFVRDTNLWFDLEGAEDNCNLLQRGWGARDMDKGWMLMEFPVSNSLFKKGYKGEWTIEEETPGPYRVVFSLSPNMDANICGVVMHTSKRNSKFNLCPVPENEKVFRLVG